MTQALVKPQPSSNGQNSTAAVASGPKQRQSPPPLTDDLVDQLLDGRGLRGWLRAARVSIVLGLLSLYLFLDTYDIRADFNRRTINRLREQASSGGRRERFKAWFHSSVYEVLDRLIKVLRYVIFRGAEGSSRKEARLVKQAIWLRESLIDLGPTFIKIGQALGTRADLLPLPYVKELALLQDQVPAFPTADAFARIELELGRSVNEAYAEIDSEPIASASLGQVYRARLSSGEEVAVKVQRPALAETISIDVAILYRLVKLTNRFFPKANEN